jgi:hypothetical protein
MKQSQQPQLLTGFGLGIVAVAQSDGYIKRLLNMFAPSIAPLPERLAPWLVGAGISITLASLALHFFPRERLAGLTPVYKFVIARAEDLPLIYRMAYEQFGNEVSSLSTMIGWHAKNPEIFIVLHRIRRRRYGETREIVGYLCTIPLTQRGLNKILSGEYSRNLLNQDIQSPKRRCAAIYIGAIVGLSHTAKGNILLVATREIESSLRNRTPMILARPITQDGLRIVLKNGFVPTKKRVEPDPETLYMLTRGQVGC